MIDHHKEIKGRRLEDSDLIGLTLIPIKKADKYFWDAENDRVISKKNPEYPYQMKRQKGFSGWSNHKVPNESYYAFTTVFGQRKMTLSELRELQPEQPKKEENMNQLTYIVGSITKANGTWSISQNPITHSDLQTAKTEAARLARVEQTKKFVVLKVEGIATIADVVWE